MRRLGVQGFPQLAARLPLALPAPRERPGQGCRPGAVAVPHTRCRGPLSRLDRIRLRRVLSAEDRALCRTMLDRHQPRKRARAPDCRLTYLLECSRFGILGGFSFVAAPMRLGPRDKWLEWSPRARGAHIAEVVDNDRFLLRLLCTQNVNRRLNRLHVSPTEALGFLYTSTWFTPGASPRWPRVAPSRTNTQALPPPPGELPTQNVESPAPEQGVRIPQVRNA
ncbi:MAG: DUF4338 domain-containing protein [Bryobacterales bacterium]|nr:DUF4338 domain-containing protein [Bryobacterales bacterium]